MKLEHAGLDRRLELIVGYFFSIAVIIVLGLFIYWMIKANFFQIKDTYTTYYKFGNDINIGTTVTLNGIIVGEVVSIDIDNSNRIKVNIRIKDKYRNWIREDSVAKIVRPLLIGNKQISITAGSRNYPVLPPGSVLLSEESSEFIDLVSGVSLQEFVDKFGLNLGKDDEANPITVRDLYDQAITSLVTLNEFQNTMKLMNRNMEALGYNMGVMGESVVKMNEGFQTINQGFGEMSGSINGMTRSLSGFDNTFQDLNRGITGMGQGINGMDNSFNEVKESLQDFGPFSDKLTSFLDELQILIEAMGSNWLFKNDVQRIKAERERARQQQQR